MKGKTIKSVVNAQARLEQLQKDKKEYQEDLLPIMNSDEVPLNPRRIIWELEKRFPKGGVMLADPSWCRIGIMQQFPVNHPTQYFAVGGLLPIGWASSAAIGMSIAKPGAKVIAVTGDGGFLLCIQCLATAVEQGLPIVWIVFDNSSYNAIAVLQRAYFGKREVGSDFRIKETGETYAPNYMMMAKAFGADGERIDRPEDIGPAIERALKSKKPYVLDFVTSRSGSRHKRSGRISWEYLWQDDRD